VNAIRDAAVRTGQATREQVANTPVEYTIRQHAKVTGKDEKFVQWAIRLSKNPDAADIQNHDWLQFVIDHEDELRQTRPYMFNRWLDDFLNRNRHLRSGNEAVGQ